TWYLSLADGVLKMSEDVDRDDNIDLDGDYDKAVTVNAVPSKDGSTYRFTYGATLWNEPDESAPTAKIIVEKYAENGTTPIPGVYTNDNTHFTGALYTLEKFDSADDYAADLASVLGGNGVSEHAYGWGATIACGTDDNFCEILPGYYRLTEKQAPDGWAIDPTPVYIRCWVDNGTAKVAYTVPTPGSVESDPEDSELTLKRSDVKPKYELTLIKRDGVTGAPLAGVTFEVYKSGAKINSPSTDPTGEVPIALSEDGTYTIREVPPAGYQGVPDYTVTAKDGELTVKGGPHGYNFKIVRGLRDNKVYVYNPSTLDTPVIDGVLPPELTVDANGDIGLVAGTLGVPNYPTGVTPPPYNTPSPTPSETPTPTPSESPTPTPEITPTPTPPAPPPTPTAPPTFTPPPPPPPPGDDDPWIVVVVDEDGTPQGEWHWDPDDEVWILEPYTPLAPPTGDPGTVLWVTLTLAATVGATFVLTRKKKKVKS
ncbi:MAG: hypothetical protein LBS90_07890, partial [Oscillospiraceae bacterium]|nr:hypothetical protein [Oscillospiraceae bacterium]